MPRRATVSLTVAAEGILEALLKSCAVSASEGSSSSCKEQMRKEASKLKGSVQTECSTRTPSLWYEHAPQQKTHISV